MLARVVIYLVLFYIAVKLLSSLLRPKGKGRRSKGPEEEDMAMDRNCKTYIPTKDAIRKKVKGETLFFCSEKCLKEYKENL